MNDPTSLESRCVEIPCARERDLARNAPPTPPEPHSPDHERHSVRLTIAGVCERDRDLLFLEELSSSADFSCWFLEATSTMEAPEATPIDLRRSVTQSTGESDLEATSELADGSRFRLLIENKIDAGLQVDQDLRYLQRAADYVAQGGCDSARTEIGRASCRERV